MVHSKEFRFYKSIAKDMNGNRHWRMVFECFLQTLYVWVDDNFNLKDFHFIDGNELALMWNKGPIVRLSRSSDLTEEEHYKSDSKFLSYAASPEQEKQALADFLAIRNKDFSDLIHHLQKMVQSGDWEDFQFDRVERNHIQKYQH